MTKKELEAEYLERFRRARPDLALADAEHGDAPDFLVRRPTHVLGIEVTRFSPAPDGTGFIPEEQDALRDRVLELAEREYYGRGGVPLHLQALFNDHRPVRSSRAIELAHELAEFLLARTINVLVYENVPFAPTDKYPYMAEIGHITATRVPERDYGVWYGGHGGWVRTAEQSDFERILGAKESLVPTYRRKAGEIWLLSVFEVLPGGTHVTLPRESSFSLKTDFDRVFALERLSGFCLEIPVAERQAPTP